MVRAIQVRQAMLGLQNGVLRVIFVALAILKVRLAAMGLGGSGWVGSTLGLPLRVPSPTLSHINPHAHK